MPALGEQAVGQAHRLHRLVVIDGADLYAGLLVELTEDRLGILLVLGAVGDDLAPALCPGSELSTRSSAASHNDDDRPEHDHEQQ